VLRSPQSSDRDSEAALNSTNRPNTNRAVPALIVLAVALAAAPAQARDWSAFPPLTKLDLGPAGAAHAYTVADSSGAVTVVAYDAGMNAWGAPAETKAPEARALAEDRRLDQVLVFNGGLFDQFAGRDSIDLGEGFTLARRDSGFALLEAGEDRGWPAVTEDEVGRWGREVRLGLPRDFPEDRLSQLLATGQLKNVPGPVVVTKDAVWIGLAGGFAGGDGQLGGLVAYDRAHRSFRVVRHKFIVDAAVISLAVRDDEVWIGTGRFGPNRLEGMRGAVLHRPKRNEWRQFAPENSRISGHLVYDLAVAGDLVWATTNQGVSRYDVTRKLWTSWYWHRNDAGFALTSELPGDLAEELVK